MNKRIAIVAVVQFEFSADEDMDETVLFEEIRDRIEKAEYFPDDVISVKISKNAPIKSIAG